MDKNEKTVNPLILVFGIISIIVFIASLSVFLYFKSLSTKQPVAKQSSGAIADMKTQIYGIYSFDFACRLAGEDKTRLLPEWLQTFISDRLYTDDTDGDDTLCINGNIYGSGVIVRIFLTDEDKENASLDCINLYINETGGYITNAYSLIYSVFPILEENYGIYNETVGDKFVKVCDGAKGRDIMKCLILSLDNMEKSGAVKAGITQNGDSAFTMEKEYKANDGYVTDFLFNLPSGFSAYEVPSKTNGSGFQLYGYGKDLEISVVCAESSKYVLMQNVNEENVISFDEYFEFINNLR